MMYWLFNNKNNHLLQPYIYLLRIVAIFDRLKYETKLSYMTFIVLMHWMTIYNVSSHWKGKKTLKSKVCGHIVDCFATLAVKIHTEYLRIYGGVGHFEAAAVNHETSPSVSVFFSSGWRTLSTNTLKLTTIPRSVASSRTRSSSTRQHIR